jgi:hypothetical protein
MRSEQDKPTMGGRRRPQAAQSRGQRSEGQYEKDAWRADRRPGAPRPAQPLKGGARTGFAGPHEPARGAASEEPYEPSVGYEPFEPGHPREEGAPFDAGPPPRYFGTGFPGRGGPGFTGGYYGFGSGSLEPDWRSGRPHPVGEASPEAGAAHRAQRRYPPGPKGYQRSDERLREDISERLLEARYIDSSDVTVALSAAKVVLEGTVPERRMKHAIEDLVDACPGVQDIDNRIRVRR